MSWYIWRLRRRSWAERGVDVVAGCGSLVGRDMAFACDAGWKLLRFWWRTAGWDAIVVVYD
jgi:hypothetical protein